MVVTGDRLDRQVYVGCYDGKLYAVNPDNGSVKWSAPTGIIGYQSPSIGLDGTVYAASDETTLCAFNPDDGSVKWKRKVAAFTATGPSIGSDGTVYVVGGILYALNPETGTPNWTFTADGNTYRSPAIGDDGTIYLGAGYNVYALNSSTHTPKWTETLVSPVTSSPAVDASGTVVVGCEDGYLRALKTSDGSTKWSHDTGGRIQSSPTIGSDGTVYVGSDSDKIEALDPDDGSVKWSYTTGSSCTHRLRLRRTEPSMLAATTDSSTPSECRRLPRPLTSLSRQEATPHLPSVPHSPSRGRLRAAVRAYRASPSSCSRRRRRSFQNAALRRPTPRRILLLGEAGEQDLLLRAVRRHRHLRGVGAHDIGLPVATCVCRYAHRAQDDAPHPLVHRLWLPEAETCERHEACPGQVLQEEPRRRVQVPPHGLAKASDYPPYSKYKASVKLPHRGKWRLRAYAPADTLHAAAWSSGYDYVTVK